ncbi:ribbon-helix-helix domain-containing protein [Methylomonas sp. ZR1]|uniref:ribbon-helix-helix domain-containing protein n=1 Tax=Methylomonas sp. ZR1 TaxID=1797072 RepID=UPI0014911F41|nr:ribbon-helix-helix domain-containing protein [Methylomonas sp. ZR1]NOV29185.1 CopG family transcriptional regulator [Methylomonas sp. ZR1]
MDGTEKRGGNREGAGRKVGTTKPTAKQSLTIRLPPDLLKALDEFGRGKNRFIECAIRQALENQQ